MNAQAAVIAHLTADNKELRTENASLKAEVDRWRALDKLGADYQTLAAEAAARAVKPVLRDSLRMGVGLPAGVHP